MYVAGFVWVLKAAATQRALTISNNIKVVFKKIKKVVKRVNCCPIHHPRLKSPHVVPFLKKLQTSLIPASSSTPEK